MTHYTVKWEIQVDAETPHEAAEKAQSMMPLNNFNSLATVFNVTGSYETINIDVRNERNNYLITGLYENTGQRYAAHFLAESAEQAEQLCDEATGNNVTIAAVINVNTGEVVR